MSTHEVYQSPFSGRYGSEAMRRWWGELHKRRLWRRVWIALAEAQSMVGLVRAEQLADLRARAEDIDVERAHAIEAEIRHDLMAELRTYAEQAPVGGPVLHLGATSMDIEDNADALRIRGALELVVESLQALLAGLCARIDELADVPTMAFTHLQPAEPTTMGYRLAQYAQDLHVDLQDLRTLRDGIRGKGFKGACGTSASYVQLLVGSGITADELESRAMAILGIGAMPVATQTYARKQDFRVLSGLASLGQSLYKFAADLRLLQRAPPGEWSEPFGAHQVGSSAMPFKCNPIDSENIDSTTRLLAALPRVAWDNAAHSYLERTLDDSANRRTILPQAFLIADHALGRAHRILAGLRIDERVSRRLIEDYGTFAATERLMMECARRGGDRQRLHERIREHSMTAWAALREGGSNPIVRDLATDPELLALASAAEIRGWLDATDYLGDAPGRARALARAIRADLPAAPAADAPADPPSFETLAPGSRPLRSPRRPPLLSPPREPLGEGTGAVGGHCDHSLREALREALRAPLRRTNLGIGPRDEGKVRDIYDRGDLLVLVATDRYSAFDRVLGTLPMRGQVLNQLSAWWFARTADIIPNHLVATPDPNVSVVRRAEPLPVEVIVRGFITGVTDTSLWTLYRRGVERPYGLELPAGLTRNDRLPRPVLTPTTKAPRGRHDERLSEAELVERGLVEPELWRQVRSAALALFARGQALAERAGLMLVDTKYEFGLIDGHLHLIDELHTPDSSRYWTRPGWEHSRRGNGEPRGLSKEFLRRWFKARAFRGDGDIPRPPDELLIEAAARYIQVYAGLSGLPFEPAPLPAQARLAAAVPAIEAIVEAA